MKIKLITVLIVFSLPLFAGKVDEADKYFKNKQFEKASVLYESLIRIKPSDQLYHYRLGCCYYELKNIGNAIVQFELSKIKFPQSNIYLGDYYFKNYQFEAAEEAYKSYIGTLKPDEKEFNLCNEKLKRAQIGENLIARTNCITLIDSLLVKKSDFIRFYKLNSELGTLKQEQIKLKQRKVADHIKYTTQRQDRCYFSDTLHGKIQLFTSYKLYDSWSAPELLSEIINSSYKTNYPFLMLDGVTLYLASDGENSLGGYDIFVTRFDPSTNQYLKPENIGFPFNSPANDYMMVIDEQRRIGWFATDRNQDEDKVMIYSFIPNKQVSIFKSGNKDSVRQVAMLTAYRKANKDSLEQITINENTLLRKTNNIANYFVVNDSVTYQNADQFKSQSAQIKYIEYIRLQNEFTKLNNDIETQRKIVGDDLSNENEKNTAKQTIIEIEKKLPLISKELKNKALQITNEENTQLQKTKNPSNT